MSKRVRVVALLTVVLAFVAVDPAQATATYVPHNVFAECLEGPKHQNIQVAEGQVITWSTTSPNRSFVSGAAAGCWYTQSAAAGTEPLRWEGPVVGNLSHMTVHVDNLVPAGTWRAGPLDVEVTIKIGPGSDPTSATTVLDNAAISLPATTFDFRNGGITTRAVFTVTGLDAHFATETGPGELVRYAWLELAATSGVNNWTWGAAEARSGVAFNSLVQAGPAVPASV